MEEPLPDGRFLCILNLGGRTWLYVGVDAAGVGLPDGQGTLAA
jgi:hypothetical protein